MYVCIQECVYVCMIFYVQCEWMNEFINACMYVYVWVYMYVCICMYCMYSANEWISERMYVCTVCVYVCMYTCTVCMYMHVLYACMYVCMYVCACTVCTVWMNELINACI